MGRRRATRERRGGGQAEGGGEKGEREREQPASQLPRPDPVHQQRAPQCPHYMSPHLTSPHLAASHLALPRLNPGKYLLGLTLHRQRQHALPTPLHAMPAIVRYGPPHRSLVYLAGRAGPAKRARADASTDDAWHGRSKLLVWGGPRGFCRLCGEVVSVLTL
jgi:hypothetical protein